ELATGCDYLIHECTFLDDKEPFATRYNHSTPMTAARVAREARVKNLVLVHYSTSLEGEENKLVEQARQAFDSSVLVARDLMVLDGSIN
nr:MBL fold metallo-hydrolase [Candidatus Sigynarchaeota archaeon]